MRLAFIVTGTCCLAFCQWLIFFHAPLEADMGIIQKIFYLHFPMSIWALFSFFIVFCGSIIFLKNNSRIVANSCQAAAEIGVLCCTCALMTGIFWAKKSWGVWWTWDPRLATTLVMWFIYCVYLLFGGLALPEEKKLRVKAVLGIIAFLDVPLVFLSARIFRSIHPAVFASSGGGMDQEMKIILLACVASTGLFLAGLFFVRKKQLEMRDRLHKILLNDEASGSD